jgi:hypothetical protein
MRCKRRIGDNSQLCSAALQRLELVQVALLLLCEFRAHYGWERAGGDGLIYKKQTV